MQYNIALNERPDYAFALAGNASIEVSKNNFDAAIELYKRAIQNINDYSFKEELADAYTLKGEIDKATEIRKELVDELAEQSMLAMLYCMEAFDILPAFSYNFPS